MRGFRGSRSAQNAISARFGRDHSHLRDSDTHNKNTPDAHANRPAIPEWLKTAETKAQEEAGESAQPMPSVLPAIKRVAASLPAPPKAREVAKKSAVSAAPKRKKAAAQAKPVKKTVAKSTGSKRKVAKVA